MTSAPVGAEPFRLGDFEIHPSEGEIGRRGGERARVDLKAMAVLVHLAAHAGRVVPKEELLSGVWPDAAVEEVALSRAVSELRRALSDDARTPRYIETLHKRGYRLIAAVGPVEPSRDAPPPGRRALLLALGAAAILGIGIALTQPWSGWRSPGSLPTGPAAKIVVLPLDNHGAPEDAFFAAGLTEEIITRLAQVRGLRVVSRTSAQHYAQSGMTASQIGAELSADYVLEGSVLWDHGDAERSRIRLTPQLIRTRDDVHLWSEVYDRELEDLFRVQTELSRRVTENVGLEILGEDAAAVESVPTDSLEAYQAYLRSLDAVGGFEPLGMEPVRAGIADLKSAIELDPRFALAHARLSLLHMISFLVGAERTPETLAHAREAAETALQLEPSLARGHMALGIYFFWGIRDYDQALTEFAIARRGLPSDSDLAACIAYIRRRQGRFDEAMAALEEAHALDPRNDRILVEIGRLHHLLREYSRADEAYAEALALDPHFTPTYLSKGWLLFEWTGDIEAMRRTFAQSPTGVPRQFRALLEYLAGNYEEALRLSDGMADAYTDAFRMVPAALFRAWVFDVMDRPREARAAYSAARRELEARLGQTPDDFRLHMSLGLALAGLGLEDEAVAHGEQAVDLLPVSVDALGGPAPVSDLARIYAAVGRSEAALDRLEYLMSIPAGTWMSVVIMEADPAFRSLREHPRYRALVAAPGTPIRPPSEPGATG